eukprot:3802067-Rhodomonas_salina.4
MENQEAELKCGSAQTSRGKGIWRWRTKTQPFHGAAGPKRVCIRPTRTTVTVYATSAHCCTQPMGERGQFWAVPIPAHANSLRRIARHVRRQIDTNQSKSE